MMELTIQVADFETGRRLVTLLRNTAGNESNRRQARYYRAAATRLERLVYPFRCYTPRVQRPKGDHINELDIQRVVRGERPYPVLSRAEARIACLRLTDRGVSAAEIAQRTHIAPRTVQRWRAADAKGAVA